MSENHKALWFEPSLSLSLCAKAQSLFWVALSLYTLSWLSVQHHRRMHVRVWKQPLQQRHVIVGSSIPPICTGFNTMLAGRHSSYRTAKY